VYGVRCTVKWRAASRLEHEHAHKFRKDTGGVPEGYVVSSRHVSCHLCPRQLALLSVVITSSGSLRHPPTQPAPLIPRSLNMVPPLGCRLGTDRARRGVAASTLAGNLLAAIMSATLFHPCLAALGAQGAVGGTSSLLPTAHVKTKVRATTRRDGGTVAVVQPWGLLPGGRWDWDWTIEEEEAEQKEYSYDSNGLAMPEDEVGPPPAACSKLHRGSRKRRLPLQGTPENVPPA